jgi:hypothetical protein
MVIDIYLHINVPAAHKILTEIASLGLENAPGNPGFAGVDSEPPPAPELHSKSFITMDITEQFNNVAQSEAGPKFYDITC